MSHVCVCVILTRVYCCSSFVQSFTVPGHSPNNRMTWRPEQPVSEHSEHFGVPIWSFSLSLSRFRFCRPDFVRTLRLRQMPTALVHVTTNVMD